MDNRANKSNRRPLAGIRIGQMKCIFLAMILLTNIGAGQGKEKFTFSDTDGRKYENVTVMSKTPAGVSFSGPGGVYRVPFEKLPEDLQKKFNYDPEAAKKQRAVDAKGASARAADMKARKDAINAKAKTKALLAKARVATFKVFNVTDTGVLANEFTKGGVVGSAARATNRLLGSGRSNFIPSRTGEKVYYLTGKLAKGITDGQIINVTVIADGTFKYTTVTGASSTVTKFKVIQQNK